MRLFLLISFSFVVFTIAGIFLYSGQNISSVEESFSSEIEHRTSGFNKSREPIQTIPLEHGLQPDKVALGEKLFHDPRLSKNNTVSCANCHNLAQGGDDNLRVSIGINGNKGRRNSPSVFNTQFNFKQFWDGRAASLSEQLDGPINSEHEMGSSWQEVLGKLSQIDEYQQAFQKVYKEKINLENLKHALVTFERSLITPNSRFDKYLRGEKDILSKRELRGYNLFKEKGCISCHQGINIGGNLFQKLGVIVAFSEGYLENQDGQGPDAGRYHITQKQQDRFVFKVPSLRNVAKTAPYFHDGSIPTLASVVRIMGKLQLGQTLKDDEVESIVAFLGTLTGEYQGKPL